MKISNLGYLFKEGIRGIFLRGFMSFAAICVTVACLLIVGSFSSLIYNISLMVEDLNQTSEIRVFIDENLSDAEAKSVHTKINQLGDNIQNCIFVSKDEALKDFIASHDNDPSFAGVTSDYLRHRCVVILEDNSRMVETAEAIQAIPGVADIAAEYELAEGFSTIEQVLQVVSVGIIAVLLVVSLLIISNTVKLAMYDRRDEIAIMKMVGATNGFIRFPFMIEGFLLGMTGAVAAFGLEWLMYDALVKKVDELEGTLELFQFVPFEELVLPMAIVFASAGLFVGVVGSWTSIRKFMDV